MNITSLRSCITVIKLHTQAGISDCSVGHIMGWPHQQGFLIRKCMGIFMRTNKGDQGDQINDHETGLHFKSL